MNAGQRLAKVSSQFIFIEDGPGPVISPSCSRDSNHGIRPHVSSSLNGEVPATESSTPEPASRVVIAPIRAPRLSITERR